MLDEILHSFEIRNDLHPNEDYEKDIPVEYAQSIMEGKDISQYGELFSAVAKMPDGKIKRLMTEGLFRLVEEAEIREDFEYNEPSEYDEIIALGDGFVFEADKAEKQDFKDKIRGAWLGRISGCLLGKPVEGIGEEDMKMLIACSKNNPMHRYFVSEDITEEISKRAKFSLTKEHCWADRISCAPADDDTNYTLIAMLLVEKYGEDFTSENVAEMWLSLQSKNACFTAERVAYINYLKGILPPRTATFKNPYREYIGAQIRADYFGYINPGNPRRAAEMAYRDASLSHVKNGIYGEMFVAAMIAAAFVCKDMKRVIRAGLSQIPRTSRLYKDITDILELYEKGRGFEDCLCLLRERYPLSHPCSWCYTNSNAMIVVSALLYNSSDFGKAICSAVASVYDTDCNGATVGSVLGAMHGSGFISEEWTAPFKGKLATGLFGYECVPVELLVEKAFSHVEH